MCAGLMEQWLIEGKFTEKEALVLSCDMLAAGIDTVSAHSRIHTRMHTHSVKEPCMETFIYL